MQFIKCNLPLRRVNLFPVGDFHWGSAQCVTGFVRQTVKMIANDPEARWVGLGDFIENAVIGSKSDVYMATMPPATQIDDIVELFEPIKDKCLFTLPGNHSQRSFRLVGLHPDAVIAARLLVPYIEYSAIATIRLTKAHSPNSFLTYWHHGHGGGYTAGGKVNAAARLRLIVPTADAIFSGHSHTTSRTPVTWYEASYKGLVKKTGFDYIIGSALSWNGSYAEEKGARPSTVEQVMVTFMGPTNGHVDNRKQTYQILSPENI